ncbi:Lrp/AsnC family transcriptional regulator [Rhodopseudomonas sp. NSM]|uniref:Lrp/AsnC family transcriptional regulator n=1 Tax=Rhodopseudomonas sp. NSM TaxID=3457630 RepID=UPI004035D3EC
MTSKLDQINLRILAALQADSSRSQRDLADEVGLSQNAYWRRLKALEASGAIAGYGARVSQEAAGVPMTVFVMVRTRRHSAEWLRRFRTQVESIPEVVAFYRISGDFDYMLKIAARDMSNYDKVYQTIINKTELETVTSYFSMEAIIDGRPFPVQR